MRWIVPALVLMLGACSGSALEAPAPPSWSKSQIESLRRWLAAAPDDALPRFDTKALDDATSPWSGEATDRLATDLALNLARAHLKGCANPVERGGWHIRSDGDENALEARLREALASDTSLDGYFSAVRPSHPEFALLQSAYLAEQDPARRITLARNLERWRWMPRDLGDDYVLVNLPAFEVGLWRSGQRVRNWPVVIGKPSLATPVFSATITHVVLNPWWEIPPSIVAENGGRFSARKGYVRTESGRWRQKPGPGNSLGKMKVSMTNPYNVYLHDTPVQSLFSHPSRAYSHGCVRVGDALGFASALLDGVMTRDQVGRITGDASDRKIAQPAARGGDEAGTGALKTTNVPLPQPLPVYIAYFTAGRRADGTLAIERDVYGRDMLLGDPSNPQRRCSN
jgi:hypothetical protein